MKRGVIVLGAVVAVLLGGFALIWFVPAVQDRIVQSAMTRQIAKNARAPYLTDDGLHILLCGTGSPMLDMTRANACAAVIANGRVVVIDAGPGAWSRLAAANIPGAKIDTVLLTHLHSDHIGDLGEVATQSWLGGRKVPLDVYGPPAPKPSEHTTDAEGETFGVTGTEDVVKGFAEAYNSDAEFRIAQGQELVPTEAARMIGHDVSRPGPEEAVPVYRTQDLGLPRQSRSC
jgi:ribonuclease Z